MAILTVVCEWLECVIMLGLVALRVGLSPRGPGKRNACPLLGRGLPHYSRSKVRIRSVAPQSGCRCIQFGGGRFACGFAQSRLALRASGCGWDMHIDASHRNRVGPDQGGLGEWPELQR